MAGKVCSVASAGTWLGHCRQRHNGRIAHHPVLLKGHPQNNKDGLLSGIRDARARESVSVDFTAVPGSPIESTARFDIVLGVSRAV